MKTADGGFCIIAGHPGGMVDSVLELPFFVLTLFQLFLADL